VHSIDKLKILQTFKYFYILNNILLVDVMLILYTYVYIIRSFEGLYELFCFCKRLRTNLIYTGSNEV